MKEKLITGRFIMKHDTEANWQKAINFVPKQGELIIYEVDETHSSPRVKIGDGATKVNDLGFVCQPINWDADNGEAGSIVFRTAGTGAAYTGLIEGITELKTGQMLIMVPHTTSTSRHSVTLNINELGAKPVYRRTADGSLGYGMSDDWLSAGSPTIILYCGSYWETVSFPKPLAADLQGAVPIQRGGHGGTTAAEARTNLGITPSNIGAATKDDIAAAIDALTAEDVDAVPETRKVNGKALSSDITLSADDVAADASGSAAAALSSAKTYTDTEIATWVGDKAVSTQIADAVGSKADLNHNHDDKYYTESEIDSKLNDKANASHTHEAYVNQNAFSNIKVGTNTVSADTTTDTVTLVSGSNVSIVADAVNDKITISATDTVYSHPNSGVTAGTYKSVTVNAQGHVTAGSNPTTLSGYGITDAAAKNHSHATATSTAAGMMSADDKEKLDNVVTLVGETSVADQIADAMASKSDIGHTHTAAQVGADPSGSAATALTNAKSYTDTKISALINSAPTTLDTLGEIAAAMEDNADVVAALEDSIGTKANASDLTAHINNKSNPHGVTLGQLGVTATAAELNYVDGVTSSIQTQLNAKVPTSRTVNGKALSANITLSAGDVGADVAGAAATALSEAKSYVDTEIAEWVGEETVSSQITSALESKADTGHTHDDRYYTESEIDTKLTGKANASHGTHVTYDSTNKPKMDGTAAFGTSASVARADHVHPTDTSRAAKADLTSHTGDTTVHVTSTERTNWNAAKTHADSAHAPSNAEKNQNAFSNITVGSTTVAADTTTDTVTFVGSNVTITPDATNDKITFAVADGTTSAKGIVKLTNSTSSTSTTTAATPNSVKSAYDLANTAKTNAATAQTKANDAYTLAESKVGSLSDLGVTATAAELNYMDGVTSNVQTQLNGKAAASHGNHVPATETANNAKFLRNDNTWQTVTPANIGAAAASHGTHVSYSSTAPVMDGTASAGSATTVARSDHKHPVDTSRASKADFDSHSGDTTKHITSTERTNWNAAYTHSTSAHAPSNAQANQNAFSNVKVGSTTIAADTTTDTLTLAGSNVTITPDATNDKVTIGITKDNVTAALGYTPPTENTTYSAAGSSLGLVKSGGDVTISSGVITVKDDSHNHTIANVDNLQTALDGKADKSQGVLYIEGAGTTDTTNKVATWTGTHSDITEYFDGLTILYKVATAGSTTTTLNINGLGAVAVVRNATTAISTACPVNGILLLTYTTDSSGTSYWKTADYDSNTKTTTGTSNKTGTKLYLAGAASQTSSGTTTYTNKNCYVGTDNCLYSNSAKVATSAEVTTANTNTLAAAKEYTDDALGFVFDTFPTEEEVNALYSGAYFTTKGFYAKNDGLGHTYHVSASAMTFYVPYGNMFIAPVGVTAELRDIRVDLYGVRRGYADYADRNSEILSALIPNLYNGYTLSFDSGHYYFSSPIVGPTERYITLKGVCSNAIVNSYDLNQGTFLHFPELADGQAAVDIYAGSVQDLAIVGNSSVCNVTIDRTVTGTDPDSIVTLVDTGTTYGIRFNGVWGYLVQNVRVQSCTYGIYGNSTTSSIFNAMIKRCKIGISVGNDTKISDVELDSVYIGIELRGQLASATNIRGDSIGKHLIECHNGKCLMSNIDGDYCVGSLIHYGGGNKYIHLGQATACMGRVAAKNSYTRSSSFDLANITDADYEYCSYISIAPDTQVFGGQIDVVNVGANPMDSSSSYLHPNAVMSIGTGCTVKGVVVKCNVPYDADLAYFNRNVIKNLSTYAESVNDTNSYLTDFDGSVIEDITFITPLGFITSKRTVDEPTRWIEMPDVMANKCASMLTTVDVMVPTINMNDNVWEDGYFNASGAEYIGSYQGQCFRNVNYIPVEGGRTVGVYFDAAPWNNNNKGKSFYIVEYDANKNICVARTEIGTVAGNSYHTLNANTAYIRLAFHKWADITESIADIKVALYYQEDAVKSYIEHGYDVVPEEKLDGQKTVLVSPNGTCFVLSVSDDGTLSVSPLNPN